LQQLRRFARHWDLIANSGNFVETTPLIWEQSNAPFGSFYALSQHIHTRLGRQHGIALSDLAELLFNYLITNLGCAPERAAASLFLLYIVAYLDRANVGFAKLRMASDLKFSEEVFGLGIGIFFIGYLLLEIPGALLVERWSARKWFARILITWGFISTLTAFV